MLAIDTSNMDFLELGKRLRETEEDTVLQGCLGQRFIAAGMKRRKLEIHGIPGNALGAYLDGADIEVFGNAQDAVGDTMNAGSIVIHGSIGDTAGYAMRGGEIYVEGDAGYRAGIHMKEYHEHLPVLVIGGKAGSFLGEYQAGGMIIVLGLHTDGPIVSNYPCTGMHGGKMFLRSSCENVAFPEQVTAHPAAEDDLRELRNYISEFCQLFDLELEAVLSTPFTVVTPDSRNPYRQMYVAN